MPLFISDEEFSRLSNNSASVAEKADAYIRELHVELETFKAKADAAAITAEQTCSLLEQKFISLSQEFSTLESQNAQLQSSLDERLAELAQAQSQKHQLHLQFIGKDGEVERLTTEVSEVHKSKRQLIELLEQKDLELSEKNATIKSYLDKIVILTDSCAQKETRVSEIEAELARSQAACTRLSQEKELIERHNSWLNEELTAKVGSLIELRRKHADSEAEISTKLADVERQYNECSSSLNWHKERLRELEAQLSSLQVELCSSKDAAAATEEQYSAELSTANKLVDLYKESSEEWSRKAGELEGVIKALETHLSQVENDYKEQLEKEVSARKHFEKEAADLKEKLEKCEAEVENSRKANELNLLPLSSFTAETDSRWVNSFAGNGDTDQNRMLVPSIPAGVSGTALAASLIRDGWSLAKMYEKYHEAVDALRHEQLGRKESEAVLRRVLCELEEKAEFIVDERAEYERMVEAYSLINEKLQNSIFEQSNLEKNIQELKAELRRYERENNLAHKEVVDLQKQVTILLKECRDIQLRCGTMGHDNADESIPAAAAIPGVESEADKIISEHLLTFKDINGLVEQNVKLRSLVRSLSDQIEARELEYKDLFDKELRKEMDEAANKVATVLERAEEQGRMIESLHTSVAMYKRLYEEEQKVHSSFSHSADTAPETGKKNLLLLLEHSEEASKKTQEKTSERLKSLEEDLSKSRSEIIALRLERDKFALEANFAREKLDSIMKEAKHQREETNGILARNVEFSQLIVGYQQKLRESSESMNTAEELSRKLSMEVSILKHEKEMLENAEKRACDEVRSLSERVHRLQASLDTIQCTEEVREEARSAEKRKQEDHFRQIEREWAAAKKELQEERDMVRNLTSEREKILKNAMKQVEDMGKELANAFQAVAAADTKAYIAEARLSDLENKIKSSDAKILDEADNDKAMVSSLNTGVASELDKVKEEAQANKNHMLQYKSIAQVNEAALKEMELAHENFKAEAEKQQQLLRAEIVSLRERVIELENECTLKSVAVASAAAGKEEALASAFAEITSLKDETLLKSSQIATMEIHISSLKDDLEKEHERWRVAQANYERQVILQSETIQELTKTSQALASLQEDASQLRKLMDALKSENSELKAKWDTEKTVLEESKNEAEKKYVEINEQNKILHNSLEALHIQLAEKDRTSAGISSASSDPLGDSGLQKVISHLRKTKEIAETEISLLKQEKLRLQSQLENALKAMETVQASLRAERANSRVSLLTEDEIKSLQLQVREISLLRESNIQLREENKHNFEECLKLREAAQNAKMKSEILETSLREKQIEVEASEKAVKMQSLEKEVLERRIHELLERCRNIDVDDYDRLKDIVQQMEQKVKEKDDVIEEIKNRLTQNQDKISQLEQDYEQSKFELNERESRLNAALQVQANMKSEIERQKKMIVQSRRRNDVIGKEKEAIASEREELSKEIQALSKQLEDLKQGKKLMGDTTSELIMKEKEEKEHRIQILEKTLERNRDELRKREDEMKNHRDELRRREDEMKKREEDYNKEKAQRQSYRKTIMDSVARLNQDKVSITSELEKHRPAVKFLSDELEKIKHAEGNLPEGTSVIQILSGTILDDRATGYLSAVENFEKLAHSISMDLGSGSRLADTSQVADASLAVTTAIPAQALPIISSVAATTSNVPTKAVEEQERSVLPKMNAETRKTGRKLVRPRLIKLEEPRGDVTMSDVEGSNNAGKQVVSQDSESQGYANLAAQSQLRKRQATSTSELHQESQVQGETTSDVALPLLKKPKGSDAQPESSEGQSAASLLAAADDSVDTTGDLPQNEDTIDDAETTVEKTEEPKESEQVDGTNELELQDDKNMEEEILDKQTEMDVSDLDNQQQTLESEFEKEEGELVPDIVADLEVADISNLTDIPEIGEVEPGRSPVASPSNVDDITLAASGGEAEAEGLTDEVEGGEDAVADGSDKSNDSYEQSIAEPEQLPETNIGSGETSVETEVSKQASSSVTTEAEEVKQVSPANNTSTVVNLLERAKERSAIRQAGARALTPTTAATASRGRGRPVIRGRGLRGGRVVRGGRGQSPGPQ